MYEWLPTVSYSQLAKIFNENKFFGRLDLQELSKLGREAEAGVVGTLRNGEVHPILEPLWMGGWYYHPSYEAKTKSTKGTQFIIKSVPDLSLDNGTRLITCELKNRSGAIFSDWLQGLLVIAAAKGELGNHYIGHRLVYMRSGAVFEMTPNVVTEVKDEFDELCISAVGIIGHFKEQEDVKLKKGIIKEKEYKKQSGRQQVLFEAESWGKSPELAVDNRKLFDSTIKKLSRVWNKYIGIHTRGYK